MNCKINDYLSKEGFAILLFHGVIPHHKHTIRNYTRKHIEKSYFEHFLVELTKIGNPISMDDIVKAHNNQEPIPPYSFAITFDDGFENNFSIAAPLLQKYKIPATFYITTNFIESNHASWIDLIEYAVEGTQKKSFTFISQNYSIETSTEKIELLNLFRKHVKNNPNVDPYQFVNEVWEQLDISSFEPDHDIDQKMSWDQVRLLHDNPLFTIGGHSHTHRILSYLNSADLDYEISTSIQMIHNHLKEPLTHYSYPEGLAHCYSAIVIDKLKESGIKCCPTAINGNNAVPYNLFHLKRFMID